MACLSLLYRLGSLMRLDTVNAQQNVIAHEKFFSRRGHRFFFAAMRLDGVGNSLDLSAKLKLRRHLEDLKEAHTTAILLSEAQLHPTIDVVSAADMVAMVEISIAAPDLLDSSRYATLISRLAHTANIYRSYTALCGYLVDLQADSQTLPSRTLRRRMRDLIRMLKSHDPHTMVAAKHHPDLLPILPEDDLLYAELAPRAPAELQESINGLHELAGERPLIVEFTDPFPDQDKSVAVAFSAGVAGIVARPVPAPASREWLGLRVLRAGDTMPFASLGQSSSRRAEREPMVSIVVCGHSAGDPAARTGLESFGRLSYSMFEVIIVAGSPDDSIGKLAAEFPQFRLIRHPNSASGAGRNAAWKAAQGEMVAFVAPGCVVDPHWLSFMVRAMEDGRLDGCAGMGYLGPEATLPARIAAVSHGAIDTPALGALHAGNVAFRKEALARIGGFDPQLGVEGCDGDIWSRMKSAGLRLGFSPAAIAWRSPDVGVRGFLEQQSGHGHDEAVLRLSHPERFVSESGGLAAFAYALERAPQSFGWMLFWTIALAAAAITPLNTSFPIAMLAAGPLAALWETRRLALPGRQRGIAAWVLIAMLGYLGNLCAGFERYRTRIQLARAISPQIEAHAEAQRKSRHQSKRLLPLH